MKDLLKPLIALVGIPWVIIIAIIVLAVGFASI